MAGIIVAIGSYASPPGAAQYCRVTKGRHTLTHVPIELVVVVVVVVVVQFVDDGGSDSIAKH